MLLVEAFAPLDAACARGLRRRMGVAVSRISALYMTYVSFVRLQWTLSRMECMHAECMRHACRFFSIVDVKVPLFLTGFRCGPRLRIEFRSAVGLPVPQVKLDD